MSVVPPIAGRPVQPRPAPFPADLDLTPVSRRPTRLQGSTLRTILDREVPAYPLSPPQPPEASVIVPTRDNLPFLRLCLESVLAGSGEIELIVIDNASTDGTEVYLDRLAERSPRVRVIRNEANQAFAVACNQGAAVAGGEILILLNDDTAVSGGWFERLAAHLDEPGVGMVGPVTNRTGNEAQIDADYRTWGEFEGFAEERGRRHAGESFAIGTLTMFCVAMRRASYEEVGPLDERFETGMLEDDDYARRMRSAGCRLLCAEDAFVHHFGETSFGKLVAGGEYGRTLDANKARFEEKWGVPWRPYERRQSHTYLELTERVRRAAMDAIRAGATILVVSRGDDELLQVPGRRAWHFPRSSAGEYAGHHPADSDEAIAWLEAERASGADYILFPRTADWWLEHYEGLQRHLDRNYSRVASDPETCAIFDLAKA